MQLDFNEIIKLIPQKFPFIMIDKVLELEPDNYAISLKNVTINDMFFPGHFPENPIMPGALIIEAIAQTAIVLFAYPHHHHFDKEGKREFSDEKKAGNKRPVYYFGSVKARFLHPVVPGDQLKIKVVNVKSLPTGAFVEAEASVDDKKVSEAELVFSVRK
jgi:3-hydroxyacyl-[acyl-carrier-protein] dehydratase